MHAITRISLAGLFTVALAGAALAQETYPDLRGTWLGKGSAIIVGSPKHHEKGQANTPRLSEQSFTFTITDQKGDRFWGTIESPKGKEMIIGILAHDKKRVLVSDALGTAEGVLLDANTFEWCYDQHSKDATMLACNTVRRQAK